MEKTLRTMELHPTYLKAFKDTHDQILHGEGPISSEDRHHIALMVSLITFLGVFCRVNYEKQKLRVG